MLVVALGSRFSGMYRPTFLLEMWIMNTGVLCMFVYGYFELTAVTTSGLAATTATNGSCESQSVVVATSVKRQRKTNPDANRKGIGFILDKVTSITQIINDERPQA